MLTPLVLQGQPIDWGHVHPAALADAELQLLEQRGQEEEHLPPGNVLPDAPPLPQAKQHHLLPVIFVHFGAVSTEETLRVEGVWVLPKLPGRENIGCWNGFSWSWVLRGHWKVGTVRKNIPDGLTPQEGSFLSLQEGTCLPPQEGTCLSLQEGSCLSLEEGTCLPPKEGTCLPPRASLTRYSLVVVHLPLVDKHAAILGDVETVQHCVLGGAGEGKR